MLIIAKGKLVAFDSPDHLETLLLASNEVTFTAEASAEEVCGIMEHIGTDILWECEAQKDETVTVRVKSESGHIRDLCRQIFFAFAEKHRAILEMKSKKANLEDVFIELTEGDEGTVSTEEPDEPESMTVQNETEKSEVSDT